MKKLMYKLSYSKSLADTGKKKDTWEFQSINVNLHNKIQTPFLTYLSVQQVT